MELRLQERKYFLDKEGRELDFGSYSLYKPSDVKQRFWTIEIHFDHSLDEIPVSNTKQSVIFIGLTET